MWQQQTETESYYSIICINTKQSFKLKEKKKKSNKFYAYKTDEMKEHWAAAKS